VTQALVFEQMVADERRKHLAEFSSMLEALGWQRVASALSSTSVPTRPGTSNRMDTILSGLTQDEVPSAEIAAVLSDLASSGLGSFTRAAPTTPQTSKTTTFNDDTQG
jgi:rubrerythrin